MHNNKYDYSKVEYINNYTKVLIICPDHGEFSQRPQNHLSKQGCRICGVQQVSQKLRSLQEEFINKSNKIHNYRYNYSQAKYTNNHTKIIIICPDHGEFYQRPTDHLMGRGCPKCGKSQKLTYEEFVNQAMAVHNNKYDYSQFIYRSSKIKSVIICPYHGAFLQTPNSHLRKQGCPKCGGTQKLTQYAFIDRSNEKHNNKYDYSKVEYVNSCTKVVIICPDHGEFKPTPNNHLRGSGCPMCAIFTGYDINNPLLKTIPGTLYYFKIIHKSGLVFYKIGVSKI